MVGFPGQPFSYSTFLVLYWNLYSPTTCAALYVYLTHTGSVVDYGVSQMEPMLSAGFVKARQYAYVVVLYWPPSPVTPVLSVSAGIEGSL